MSNYLDALDELDTLRDEAREAERLRQLRLRDESVDYWRRAATRENDARREEQRAFGAAVVAKIPDYFAALLQDHMEKRYLDLWQHFKGGFDEQLRGLRVEHRPRLDDLKQGRAFRIHMVLPDLHKEILVHAAT